MNAKTFETIATADLAKITGGENKGPNQWTLKGELEGEIPMVGVKAKGQASIDLAFSNYQACAYPLLNPPKNEKRATPAELKDACGLPPP